jgi:hypothetical protein
MLVVLSTILLLLAVAAPSRAAGPGPKVVVVVGPVGALNATYRKEARLIVAEARRHTPNVVLLESPRATWSRVKAAAQGASIFVFFGHGNGHPSIYGQFHGDTKNGLGLDPATGADGRRHVNYGEDRIRASIQFAPDAAVLLYRMCYASGNTEPGQSEGSTTKSRQRVDGYASGFLDAGAGIVLADGHPKSPADYVRQLFTTDRTMWEVFRAAPNFHGHVLGPYASRRTPGSQYALDPDRGGADPAGFYRSAAGRLDLTTWDVTQRPAPAESVPPPQPEREIGPPKPPSADPPA